MAGIKHPLILILVLCLTASACFLTSDFAYKNPAGESWSTSSPKNRLEQFFSETGHTVKGEFLLKYLSEPNYKKVYGYPITEAFQDPTTGRLVQYFQKARFELVPDAPPDQRVQLTPLGQFLRRPGLPAPSPFNPAVCRYFPETGFRVCRDFLDFFDKNGGVARFGLPLSDMEDYHGVYVQHFQYARLEYYPSYPPGQTIVVADLGSQYFFERRENQSRLGSYDPKAVIKVVLSLIVSAYPAQAVTGGTGSQTVYITVLDQTHDPIANTQVTISLRLPDGKQYQHPEPLLTNQDGVAEFSFSFSTAEVGDAEIFVTVLYDGLQGSTTTSFNIWY